MPSETIDNHYASLGVPYDATQREILLAYHEAAKKLHPDANPSPEATDQFLRIQEAFDTLSDPDARAEYNLTIGYVEAEAGLRLSSLLSRSNLPRLDEPQLFYVLLRLDPFGLELAEGDAPVNLSMVIDTSTSMKGQRMDMVKITARRILRKLNPEDVVSIISFSDRAEVVVEAGRNLDRKKTEARISQVQTGGGTEIYRGLQAGYAQIMKNQRSSRINHLILITDGNTYGDEEKCLGLADDFSKHGITISALGLGQEWNEIFLDHLAGKTGGASMYVAYSRDIKKFLEQKVERLHEVVAENIRLELDNPQLDFSIKYVFRAQPDATHLEAGTSIPLGSLSSGQAMVLLLEFLIEGVDSQANSLELMNGSIRYELIGSKIPADRKRVFIDVPIRDDHLPEMPPQEIVQTLARLTLYRMQEQVRTDLEKGEYQSATRRLRHMATHVLAAGDQELGSRILSEAARLESGARRSRRLRKSIMYGTKSLFSKEIPQTSQGRQA